MEKILYINLLGDLIDMFLMKARVINWQIIYRFFSINLCHVFQFFILNWILQIGDEDIAFKVGETGKKEYTFSSKMYGRHRGKFWLFLVKTQ
jgi:hypothetical protein